MSTPEPTVRSLLEVAIGAPLPKELTTERLAEHVSENELVVAYGITPKRAQRLTAALEAGRRLSAAATVRGTPMRGGGDVYRFLSPQLRTEKKEHFVVLLLDGRHRLLRDEIVSVGSLTASIVHPREVFAPAIREKAAAIIVAHNHPSGDPAPSQEDLAVTARLQEVGRLVGIELLDHVVIGDPGYVSLRERGHLDPPASS